MSLRTTYKRHHLDSRHAEITLAWSATIRNLEDPAPLYMSGPENSRFEWLKVFEPDQLPAGRVTTVTCRHLTLCMTRHEGAYGALSNKCPHQGGPLGEGSIENGLLAERNSGLETDMSGRLRSTTPASPLTQGFVERADGGLLRPTSCRKQFRKLYPPMDRASPKSCPIRS